VSTLTAERLRSAGFFYDAAMAAQLTAWERYWSGVGAATFLWTDCDGRRWMTHPEILADALAKVERAMWEASA
jgi:hypothetical protein